MKAEYGEEIQAMVYIVRDAKESMLGLAALGIISIRLEGRQKQESVG